MIQELLRILDGRAGHRSALKVNWVVPTPADHFSVGGSAAVAVLLGLVFGSLLVVYLREIAYCIRRALSKPLPAVPGEGQREIVGIVELKADSPFAVRVEIEQRAQELPRLRGTSHRWSEAQRRTFGHAFWIRCASDERVRVEPPPGVKLICSLSAPIRVERDRRFLVAEVRDGQQITLRGTFEGMVVPESGGYRQGGQRAWRTVAHTPLEVFVPTSNMPDIHKCITWTRALVFGWILPTLLAVLLCLPYLSALFDGATLNGWSVLFSALIALVSGAILVTWNDNAWYDGPLRKVQLSGPLPALETPASPFQLLSLTQDTSKSER